MIDNSTDFKPVKDDNEPPINHEFATGGDITIRSSDDVDFSVHIIVLSLASSAFSDLLSNPTRPDVIKVSETADLIALTLGSIYPKPPPAISSFELLDKALHVANKYHLEGMKSTLRKRLVETGSEVSIYADPLQALAIATSHHFEKDAKMAASVASRDLSFDTPDHLFKLMNAVPLSAPWVRLTGIPPVQTQVVANILFGFHQQPMLLLEDSHARLLCSYCRPIHHKIFRHSPPEWQARWAYWIFQEIKTREIEECEEFFHIGFFLTAWHRTSLSSTPTIVGSACSCLQVITTNWVGFHQWASLVYAQIRKELSELDELRFL